MKRIRLFIGREIIKVLMGIRRSGKSVMLSIIQEDLRQRGVSNDWKNRGHEKRVCQLFDRLFFFRCGEGSTSDIRHQASGIRHQTSDI